MFSINPHEKLYNCFEITGFLIHGGDDLVELRVRNHSSRDTGAIRGKMSFKDLDTAVPNSKSVVDLEACFWQCFSNVSISSPDQTIGYYFTDADLSSILSWMRRCFQEHFKLRA
ncbi:hypothetical protein NPIL_48181 [Nephila pilipes]|uniref:Uncharacterized protein n=1 Tax=Nephila pilipes TaxID=299642 RepID=A0A8X6PKL0_NEPPI|nr:hypothetical protein NPIL_48181 [Nephila pilipes]